MASLIGQEVVRAGAVECTKIKWMERIRHRRYRVTVGHRIVVVDMAGECRHRRRNIWQVST